MFEIWSIYLFLNTVLTLQAEYSSFDWSVKLFYNGCLWDFFFKVQPEFSDKDWLNFVLTDNHYKNIYEQVWSECSSWKVLITLVKTIVTLYCQFSDARIVQDTDVSVQKHRPFILMHAH